MRLAVYLFLLGITCVLAASSNNDGKSSRRQDTKKQTSIEVFGKKISFRPNVPSNLEDASKSISRFFSNVKTDAATRIVFVIYLNLVVMFVTYILFFIKQVQLHRRQMREEKMSKKQRKMDEEQLQWLAHGETAAPKNMTLF